MRVRVRVGHRAGELGVEQALDRVRVPVDHRTMHRREPILVPISKVETWVG